MPDPPTSASPITRVTEHVYAVDAGALYVYLMVLPKGLTLVEAGFPGTMDIVEDAARGRATSSGASLPGRRAR